SSLSPVPAWLGRVVSDLAKPASGDVAALYPGRGPKRARTITLPLSADEARRRDQTNVRGRPAAIREQVRRRTRVGKPRVRRHIQACPRAAFALAPSSHSIVQSEVTLPGEPTPAMLVPFMNQIPSMPDV